MALSKKSVEVRRLDNSLKHVLRALAVACSIPSSEDSRQLVHDLVSCRDRLVRMQMALNKS